VIGLEKRVVSLDLQNLSSAFGYPDDLSALGACMLDRYDLSYYGEIFMPGDGPARLYGFRLPLTKDDEDELCRIADAELEPEEKLQRLYEVIHRVAQRLAAEDEDLRPLLELKLLRITDGYDEVVFVVRRIR
jgi:hypothetical protein